MTGKFKKIYIASAVIAAAFFAGAAAQAATISVLPANASGVEGSTLNFTIDGAGFDTNTLGGGLQLSWDPAVLQLQTGSIIPNTAVFNSDPFDGTPANLIGSVNNGAGTWTGFSAFANFLGAGVGSANFNIVQLTFTLLNPGTSAINVSGVAENPWVQLSSLDPINVMYTGAFVNVTPVPLPASVWLLGSALGALGYSVRKRKTAAEAV